MLKTALLVAGFAALNTNVVADNNDMVVLIHGWTGESTNFEQTEQITEAGLDFVAVNINSLVGDMDRACETYAQIMGTVVDYGVCHSRETGIQRFGEDFTGRGLYPEWSADNHIHVMGHSQGGITARFLQDLMILGSGCDEDTSPFLTGGKPWITSITTWATPHSLVGTWDRSDPTVVPALINLYANKGFALPQYGLTQQDGETFDSFVERVRLSGFFESDNFALNGWTSEAMKVFNSAYPRTFDGTYYFAFACERTNPDERCNAFGCTPIEVPDPAMSANLKFISSVIGSTGPQETRENDGIVSQSDARCPAEDKPCTEVADGDLDTWEPSVWHYVDIDYLDHNQIVGRDNRNDNNNYDQSSKKLWLEHSVRLKALPSNSAATTRVDNFETKEKAAAARRFLEARKVLSQVVEVEAPEVSGGAVFGVVVAVFVGAALLAFVAVKGVKKMREVRESVEETTHYL